MTIAANEMKSISMPNLCDSTTMFELTQSERINIAISSPYVSRIFNHSKRINKNSHQSSAFIITDLSKNKTPPIYQWKPINKRRLI
jgi:hypothetical protein